MHRLLAPALFAFIPLACAGADDHARLEGDEEVLATVSGEPITANDLERGIRDSLPAVAGQRLEPEGRHEVLESLVVSRLMARAEQEAMSPTELEELDRDVEAHRERVLVRRYIERHGTVEATTEAQVRAYYDEHASNYREEPTREYEMLFTSTEVPDGMRVAFLRALGEPSAQADWRSWSSTLQSVAGANVVHEVGASNGTRLHPRISQLVSGLRAGETSPIVFVDGRAFVVRVTRLIEGRTRPIGEVSAEIRQALEARQLREVIRSLRAEVLEGAEVEYTDTPSRDVPSESE